MLKTSAHIVCLFFLGIIWQVTGRNSAHQQSFVTFKDKNFALCYWQSHSNFGDELSGAIVTRVLGHHFGTKVNIKLNNLAQTTKQKPRKELCLFALGSIIHLAQDGDVIWGSGVMGDRLSRVHRDWKIYATRGPESINVIRALSNSTDEKEYVNLSVPMGDPAALLSSPKLFGDLYNLPPPSVDVCVMFHYNDRKWGTGAPFKNVKVISPSNPWEVVVRSIQECKRIVCSSLHCIIVAEVLSIPAVWLCGSQHSLKYQDYFMSTNRSNVACVDKETLARHESWPAALQDSGAPIDFSKMASGIMSAFPFDMFKVVNTASVTETVTERFVGDTDDFWEVFIDDNNLLAHLEIFEGVTRLARSIILSDPLKRRQRKRIKFIFRQQYFEEMGGLEFFETYAPGGVLQNDVYEFRRINSLKVFPIRRCSLSLSAYDLQVFVTLPSELHLENGCLLKYENESKVAFVLHHVEPGSATREIAHWTNAYMASKSKSATSFTPRTFSPTGLLIPPRPPDCNPPVTFIVQGNILKKRDLQELRWILGADPSLKFVVKVLTKYPPPIAESKRLQYFRHLNFTEFHLKILGAAFMLPLISPHFVPTRRYFLGNPSSSIAYGTHFKLRFFGHSAILDEYAAELNSDSPGYWHNGTEQSVHETLKAAMGDFNAYCSGNSNSYW